MAKRNADYAADLRSERCLLEKQPMPMHQKGPREGSFETGGQNAQPIYCSDNACPCSEGQGLEPGRTAYLYISQAVVNFRAKCPTLIELDILLQRHSEEMGSSLFVDGGIANPIFLCEAAARLRGLDLDVARADAKVVVETGWAPLRPTPNACEPDL